MMNVLSHLRAALRDTNSDSLHGLTFDAKLLDQETSRLRAWLGDRGTAKPPQDAIVAALHAFQHDQCLKSRRQALLVCFGCIDPVLVGASRLIEDGERFSKLLGAVDAYIPTPRVFRPCYRGLLNAYFGYDPETARSAGKQNWGELRTYLRDRVVNTIAPGLLPTRNLHEDALNRMNQRASPEMMRRRRCAAEYPFGTIKRMMGGGRFLTRNLKGTATEMALSVLAYNMLRAISIKTPLP